MQQDVLCIDLNISAKVTERYHSIEVDALASPNKLNYKANGLVLGVYALVILNDLRSAVLLLGARIERTTMQQTR
jgi:hypothetical protein